MEKRSLQTWLHQQAASPVRRRLILAVALGLSAGVLLIVQAGLLGAVVHDVVFDGRTVGDVAHMLILLPLLMLLRFGLVWLAENFGVQAALRVKADLRMRLYTHLQRMGPERLRTRSIGALTHQVVDGVEGLEAYYARFLPQAALAALIPLAVLAFVFPLDLTSGLILLGTAPFIPVFMVLIGGYAEKLNQRQWRRLAALSARFLDSLQGLPTIRAFNAVRREADIIARITDDYRRTTIGVLRVAFLSALALEFLATISLALVAIFIGFKLLAGDLLFQHGFFILLLAPEFYLPLRNLGTQYHARLSALAAAEGLMAILAEPAAPAAQRREHARPRWRSVALHLDGVRYRYPGRQPVLRGLQMTVPAGTLAVLAGPSGSGKTTALRLLLGSLVPDRGTIAVNGADLARLSNAAWLAHVAWVPQSAFLFQGTLLENLLLPESSGAGAPDMGALDRAAALTGLDRDLAALPQGWHTRLAEGGEGLSGGQRRRLALTRAVLKDAPLLLLDEPTAHLDAAGRGAIVATLRSLAGRHTIVAASHDPELIEAADKVVWMNRDGDGGAAITDPGAADGRC
ncbi:thiol reductant ABC exporter subunit CydD [Desulfatitalea alkaliphila]|uniref:Thiol reductant ABC exporter subunit CydD n=1 Tax=Desulfatitalea alkaliphila TaxID=2929485 RepID=A0AA41R1I6_9BACT|nr:thiol reductant ABC exporter subunit CydD [Desulfatitalea alkaliphila]MCJ8501182.1 thiol reductant ABC exporter subunit CydD [Desulfatitalea alkaliphila]